MNPNPMHTNPEPRGLPIPNPDVVSQTLGDEAVLVHLGTNRIFSLNSTGARFWELLTEGHERVEIESRLSDEFGVTPETASAAIDGLVDELWREGIVTFGPQP